MLFYSLLYFEKSTVNDGYNSSSATTANINKVQGTLRVKLSIIVKNKFMKNNSYNENNEQCMCNQHQKFSKGF